MGISERYDWIELGHALGEYGNAILPALLTPAQCRQLAALYPLDEPYRSRVVMGRHGFGRGEYKYFAYPLP
ncbi:MAG TPA: proline hydroxylase, partial [Herbaspirillum sp.]